MTTRRILLRITSISLLMVLLAVGGLLAQPTPPPNIADHNIITTTFTFDDGADPSVWFSGTYAIAPQADGGYGMSIALDDAPVTLNRPLLDGETLAVTLRRGVGRAGVRLVSETAAYTVWIETSGIAVLERDGAEQGRVPVAGDAQRVTLTYASGTLSASVGEYAFPPISDGTAFASLRAEFVVQGGNGQGSTFDEVNIAYGSEAGDWTFITFAEEDMVAASALYSPDNQFRYREFWETFNDNDPLDFYQSHITDSTSAGVMIGFTEGFISYPPLFTAPYMGAERTNDFSSEIRLSTEINLPARPGGHTITGVGVSLMYFRKSNSPFPISSSDVTIDFYDANGVLLHSSLYCRTNTTPSQCANPRPIIDVQHVQRIVVKWSQPAGSGVIYRMAFDNIRIVTDEVIFNPDYQGLLGNYWNGFSLLDTPAIANRIDGNLTFPTTWDMAGLADSDRFTVRWTGEIQLSIPPPTAPEATPESTPEVTPEITPESTPTTEPTSLRFCFRTRAIPAQPDHEGLRLWIGQEEIELTGQVDPTDTTRYEYCSSAPRQVVFNDGWLPIYIEYWRYAAVDVDLANPTFAMTWEDMNGQFERMAVPVAQLRAGNDPVLQPPGPILGETPRLASLAYYAACPNNQFQLVPVFPGRGQELLDMQAVANEGGLIIHDGPTWNAVQYGTIPWGTVIEVDRRMVFEQADVIADQVWYRVGSGSPYYDSDNDRWIAVRMAGTVGSGATSSIRPFMYAVGMSGLDANTSLFCNDVPEIEPDALISFTYDRQAAAEYGIRHSYNNNTTQRPTGRVTERISSFFPYANFFYSELNPQGDVEATGSAQFVSELLWVGGMPMTNGLDDNCGNPPPIVNFGWRYCENVSTSSKAWSVHGGIGEHFTSADFPIPPNTSSNILADAGTQMGYEIRFEGLAETYRIDPFQDWNTTGVFANQRGGGPPVGSNPGGLDQNRMGQFTAQHLAMLRHGDYVWIWSDVTAHGLVIVGWQDAYFCEEVVSDISDARFLPTDFYASLDDVPSSIPNPVPYVVDYTTAQSPMARPFYCTMYAQTSNPPPGQTSAVTQFAQHFYYFYVMPSQVQVFAPQLHTNIDWDWSRP